MRTSCTTPLVALGLVASLATVCGGGCRQAEPGEAAPDAGPPAEVELSWQEQPLSAGRGGGTARATPVKEGTLPLVYLSDMAATVRVTQGQRILAEAEVEPRTIVRVDARNGVVFGRYTLRGGPLPADRRYAIVIVPDGESVSRVGVTRPVKKGRPADEAVRQAPAEAEPAPVEVER